MKLTPQNIKKVYYVKHRSARQAALILGCSPTTLKNYLDKYDFRVKRRSEVMRGRTISPEHRAKVIKNLKQF